MDYILSAIKQLINLFYSLGLKFSPQHMYNIPAAKLFVRFKLVQIISFPDKRRLRNLHLYFFILLLSAGCSTVHNAVTDAHIPFYTPLYSILPPKGVNWRYIQDSNKTSFGNINLQRTHGYLAVVKAIDHSAEFESQDDFMNFINTNQLSITQKDTFEVIKQEKKFDNKFGEYCILHSIYLKEQNGTETDDQSVYTKCHEYYFIHPYKKNIIINIGFTERGIKELFSSLFQQQADEFIDGLKLREL